MRFSSASSRTISSASFCAISSEHSSAVLPQSEHNEAVWLRGLTRVEQRRELRLLRGAKVQLGAEGADAFFPGVDDLPELDLQDALQAGVLPVQLPRRESQERRRGRTTRRTSS